MSERLNNEQIYQRIIYTNSDVQRYLDLAPSYKPTLKENQKIKDTTQTQILAAKFQRMIIRP
jgi:hypothetical protein